MLLVQSDSQRRVNFNSLKIEIVSIYRNVRSIKGIRKKFSASFTQKLFHCFQECAVPTVLGALCCDLIDIGIYSSTGYLWYCSFYFFDLYFKIKRKLFYINNKMNIPA